MQVQLSESCVSGCGAWSVCQHVATPVEWWSFIAASLTKDELLMAVFGFGVWHVWKERCRHVLQQMVANETQLTDFIRDDILLVGSYWGRRHEDLELEPPIEAHSRE